MTDARVAELETFVDCLCEGRRPPPLSFERDGPADRFARIVAKLERFAAERTANPSQMALFSHGPVVVFRWRNEEGWPVEFVSANVEQLTGYPVEEFASGRLPYASLIHADDIERVGQEVADNAASAAWFEHEPYRIERRDGRELWIYDYTVVLRDETGAATHFYGYIMDMSERREHEQLITQQLEVIHSIGVPLMQVWNGVLAVPLVGLLSEERAEAMTGALLERVAQASTRAVIIDLTGIEQIDTSTVLHLHRTSQALALLGCRCLLTGVCALMARTMVTLGVEFSGVEVHRTLAAALQAVLLEAA